MRRLFSLVVFAAALVGQPPKLAGLLPDPSVFGGRASSPAVLYGADLYRYLDGGAEAYRKRGFVALIHREYKAGDIDLTADIYDMGAPARAFGIYLAERSPDSGALRIGREGYSGEGFLNFVQGRYYIKLIAFSERSKTAAALEAAARSIAGKIHV
ncbi:MAG: hypothetical protein LAQ30_06100 [Acidobacteriia bacterium]|nr:hypothetical protein [Terriglobia bacterium]